MRAPAPLLLAAALAACTDHSAPPPPTVYDGFLHDTDGRVVIMRGVNLSGAQKNTPYIDDKTADDYARVSNEWGMNAVRFVMTWSAVEPEQGFYDEPYLDTVADRMQWAATANLRVILDMHEDIYGEGFGFDGAPAWTCAASYYAAFMPKTPWFVNATDPNVMACTDGLYTRDDLKADFTAMWAHVAARLADSPAIVGFDVLNEPNWGSYSIYNFERDRLEPFYEQVVPAVRAHAPGWVAFLEPGASRNAGIPTSLHAFPFGDVVYAPHSYDNDAESGSGYDPSHDADVIANIADLQTEATMLDAGLWIGEYGGQGSDPNIGAYMGANYDGAGAAAASEIYWSYDKSDGGYGLLDSSGNEKPALIAAVVRPYPERVAGTPVSYGFDPATSTFTFVYKPDPKIAAPTVISVPADVYEVGYEVDCGGCQWAYATSPQNEVVITGMPPVGVDGTTTVTITPSPTDGSGGGSGGDCERGRGICSAPN